MAERLLQLSQARVRVADRALVHDVSVTIHAGERVAILGPNGAGKTTLLRAMHGLTPLSAGRLHSVPTAQQAMVFQRPTLLRTTALENVLFVLRAHGRVRDVPLATQALQACGLAAKAQQQARTLSGGEQQRLALACVWALRSRLLFADEPTANLDRHALHEVEAILSKLHAEGTTLVMVTHSFGQAKRLSDRVLFMSDGRLLEDVPTATFFSAPRTAEAVRFLQGD